MLFRCALGPLAWSLPLLLSAQHIDSVHVFRTVPARTYTSASAETMAWQLHRQHAAYATIGGVTLDAVNEALIGRKTTKHVTAQLPKLAWLGLAWAGGGIQVVGIMEDCDVVVNLTARREYRLDDWADRVKVRTLLVALEP